MKALLLVVGLSGLAAACVPVDHGYYGAPGAVVISTSGGYGYGYPYRYGYGYGMYRRPVDYGRFGYGGAWYGPRYGVGHVQPGSGYPYGDRGGSYYGPAYGGHAPAASGQPSALR